MAPKPRPVRKLPNAVPAKDASASIAPSAPAKDILTPSTSMPPPPAPLPPLGILEGEIGALGACLQSAVVKTAQIYGFYTDVKRLGISQHQPAPPRSLTQSLRREVIKYDQFCDAMESHLLRAITVLQRDLAREEARIKAEEEAAAASKVPSPAASGMTPPSSPQPSELLPDGSLRARVTSVNITPARRQSTISLSSLSRPAFPPRLDLSASALRINPDEMMIPSGFSSPVTLAPRTARAQSHPPPDILMPFAGDPAARPVDIDLTVDADIAMAAAGDPVLDPGLGSSVDKPIELDIDMGDMGDISFFANGPGASGDGSTEPMFGPHPTGVGAGEQDLIKPKEEAIDIDLLSALAGTSTGAPDDISAFLEGAGVPSGSQPQASDSHKAPAGAPSPGTLLAGFGAGPTAGTEGAMVFDGLEINQDFFAGAQPGPEVEMMNVEDILNSMGGGSSNTSGAPTGGST
ncbi:uncharacterized protein BXZ73DRAFT_48827 [Epithele typhae]|uniref:uncharacterized protein n=1 Tax=Epithele typhae TaxID=378194 RepID=UPI0020071E6E|nr:uncharacterized protein BXZ73DRAFT_48827 [Epithele typhae]KAH9927458.1 hypothetical protein BXZ73DRAFT_48827 [Epithele typhae]